MKVCAIVPSHNHHRALPAVIERLCAAGLAVFVIDDGSVEPAHSVIAALHNPSSGVTVRQRDVNGGKGAAVMDGFRLAEAEGFTHAVQVDADGQHDLAALPKMLDLAARYPDAVICGHPIYDDTVPTARHVGHWFTNAACF